MDEPPVISLLCSCGQLNHPHLTHCVRCHRPLSGKAVSTSIPADSSGMQFSLASLMLTISVVAVALGLFAAAPGLGIIFGVLALPPLIRTALVVQRRKQLGKDVSPSYNALLFLGSFGVTILVSTVVVVVGFGTFCAVCLGLAAATRGDESVIPIAALVGLVAAGMIIAAFWLWIRRRWEDDTTS